jgi:CPA2 family monovalent cation:H+ antiporter-2
MTEATLIAVAAAAQPHGELNVLTALAVILCVAAVTTLIFQRIRQPVVLGYLLAGLIVGPHVPVPLFADEGVAHTLSELGVILLMFSLGLEFSLRQLIKVGPTAGIVAVIQCSLMIWLGYLVGRAFGWTSFESIFAGALIAISSTTIIVKAFAERGVKGPMAELVFGILIVEDLIAILLLAILTAAASGAGLSAGGLALTIGRLAAFLAGLLVVGMLVVPRLVRLMVRLGRTETTVVASVGIAFAFALLAQKFGYSVALGAFLGGALVAESGQAKTIERAIEPVKDVFAAIFFVSVGMLIDPVLVAKHWGAVLVLTLVVVAGKVVGVALGAFIAGSGVRTSVQAGLSLAQIGEFSFIIAALGVTLGVVGNFLYAVAVAVSAITTLLTPWLIRVSGSVATYVDGRLPTALQTYASLYGAWVEDLRGRPRQQTVWRRIRRLVVLLLVDVAAIASIVIAASLNMPRLLRSLGQLVPIAPGWVRALVVLGAVALSLPFLLGAVRLARALGIAVAREALPSSIKGLDLAAAPRRALLVTIQLAILLLAGVPLAAITQPFVPSFPSAALLVLAIALLIVPFWRSAANLQSHARAGAQVILEALALQSHGGTSGHGPPREEVARLVPGLGDASALRLVDGDPAVGKTLKQLNLRGLSGASVIAIDRGHGHVLYPTGDDVLRAGDALVLTGTDEAVKIASGLLGGASAAPEGEPPANHRGPA